MSELPEHASLRSKRILVVDDNVDAAAGVRMLLQACGHDVRAVHRGGEVLEATFAHGADVIFLDIGLPDVDGYEIARALRKHPRGQSIRLIALTGFGSDQDKRRALAAGFDQHLTKPADLRVLRAALLY